MHEVEVEVIGIKLFQSVFQSKLDMFGVMVDLEELRGDENLGSGYARGFNTLTDLSFVGITPSTADDVSV